MVGLGFKVRIIDTRARVLGLGFRSYGAMEQFRVLGLGFRVSTIDRRAICKGQRWEKAVEQSGVQPRCSRQLRCASPL
jgi:hypothetical protein